MTETRESTPPAPDPKLAYAENTKAAGDKIDRVLRDQAKAAARLRADPSPAREAIERARSALAAQEAAEDSRDSCPECSGDGQWEHCGVCSVSFGDAIVLRRAVLSASPTEVESPVRAVPNRVREVIAKLYENMGASPVDDVTTIDRDQLEALSALSSTTWQGIEGDAKDELPAMFAAFRTTTSGPDGYVMTFKFADLNTLHRADDEWHAFRKERSNG